MINDKCLFVSLLYFLLLIIGDPITSLYITPSLSTQLYVVPFPSFIGNDGDGSLAHPYSSLQQALDHIENEYNRDTDAVCRTTIHLYPTHHFVDTIRLTQAHSHIRLTTMSAEDTGFYKEIAAQEHTHQRLPTASISGGIPITGWTHVSANTYSATLQQPIFVNQLFINKQRIVRTRVPTNYSDYLQYAAPLKDPTQARYGFQYQLGQFHYKSLTDAMVVVYHSWTTSHHYIDHLITSNNTIVFTNPSGRPIGSYTTQANRRFHIENLCEALTSNSFCFVNQTKTVTLMTDGSYDPTKVQIITPIKEFVMIIAGENINKTVHNITIDNVAIQHSAWNIGRTQQADFQAAAFLTYAAVYIANATSIIMSDVEVSHTGSYGVWIKEGTTNINIINSLVTDTGAGGIRIGQTINPVPTPTRSVNITSNEVSYGGNVFPSGVGVISHRARDIVIADNLIHHHRYTGVSVGWQWGYAPSGTSNVLVQRNYIHDIGRHILCDQGGIYTLGIQPGTVITNNVIKNVFSYAQFMWGIYLDEGSSQIVVSNNVVYNTGWASMFQHYGANNTIINNVFARASFISPPHPHDPSPDGDIHIGLRENHRSWTYIRNIVYDTYRGSSHSAFTTSEANVIASFSDNVYYNTYGTPLRFGSKDMSFADWQKTGQDKNSVIADPLFVGDVNQCDFFTVQAKSPAAKLGFANITKLSKWTPGCGIYGESDDNQFYHW
jgi:parallel beta-helix repeat protein